MIAVVALALLLGGAAPPTQEPFRTDTSPSGALIADHYELPDAKRPEARREIWLRDGTRQSPPVLLFAHYRDAEVLIAPNEQWIAITDHHGSDRTDVRLFRRVKGLQYEEVAKAEVGKKCWALFDRRLRRPASPAFSHVYVHAIKWAATSRALLVSASGYASGGPVKVDDWLCVFDVGRLDASTDLELMNRGVVRDDRK